MDYFERLIVLLIVLCVLPISTVAQATDANHNPPPPLGKLGDVGGYKVHLYCTGAGSPTVGLKCFVNFAQPQRTRVCRTDIAPCASGMVVCANLRNDRDFRLIHTPT